MSIKSSVGHTLNGLSELAGSKVGEAYLINHGVDHGLSNIHYNERLLEVPFVFRHIRNAPARVIDVGCVESIVPVQLSMMGYDVSGIDIRSHGYVHSNFKFIRDDFITHKFSTKFDVAIDISAIEHFGLHSYGAGTEREADMIAVRKIHGLLKDKGQFLFTAPYGMHEIVDSFQRVYDASDIKRLLGGFKILDSEFYKVIGHRTIRKVDSMLALSTKYRPDEYAVVLINAQKRSG